MGTGFFSPEIIEDIFKVKENKKQVHKSCEHIWINYGCKKENNTIILEEHCIHCGKIRKIRWVKE